ncbi:MAG: NADAR family protein [Richelia sp. RM1_1_1]|nr:NADAR family protein [Richelia sp. RM1_1_1]
MGDFTYPTVEHAFQAAKTLDSEQRKHIASLVSPEAAKKTGTNVELRTDWEEIKLAIMCFCLSAKFSDENWYRQLKMTGEEQIVEWNNWGDKVWGVPCHQIDTGLWVPYEKLHGENLLGRLLMYCRNHSRKNLNKIHEDYFAISDDANKLKEINIQLLKNILPAAIASEYIKIAVDNHTLPSERIKVAVYGNATKLNLDAEMRLGKIVQLNAQIYLQERSLVKNAVLKYLAKLNYTRICYVDIKHLNLAKYGLLLTNKDKPRKPRHKLCRIVKI